MIDIFILNFMSKCMLEKSSKYKIVLGIIDLSGQSYVIITYLVYKQHKHLKNLSNLLYIPTLLYTKVFAIPLTAKGL